VTHTFGFAKGAGFSSLIDRISVRGAKCPLCHEASHARLLINRLLVRDPYSSYTHCSLPTTHFLPTHTKQATCSLPLTNSYNMLHWRCRSGTDPILAPKPWLSATRSLRLIQNPQPHPGHRLINSALPQPLHNQHFRNCSFRSTLTPVSATLTKNPRGSPRLYAKVWQLVTPRSFIPSF